MTHLPFIVASYALGVVIPGTFMIAAFLRAFPEGGKPLLVLKTGPGLEAMAEATVERIRAKEGGSGRVLARTRSGVPNQ